jgi:hypothetical protein
MSLNSACSGLVRTVKRLDGTRDHRGLDRRFRSVVQWCSPAERETALRSVEYAARISPVLADNARYAAIDKYQWRIH